MTLDAARVYCIGIVQVVVSDQLKLVFVEVYIVSDDVLHSAYKKVCNCMK